MGVKAGPRIVQNGLILDVDAAVSRSYSGTGLTANGLVGGIGGTLVNGVGFGTTNNGFFTFDGSNDFMPFNISTSNTILTIDMWAKLKNFSNTMPFGFFEYDVFTFSGSM